MMFGDLSSAWAAEFEGILEKGKPFNAYPNTKIDRPADIIFPQNYTRETACQLSSVSKDYLLFIHPT